MVKWNMISKHLQSLFLLSLLLIAAHGIEEAFTDFRHTDSFVIGIASWLNMTPEMFYWVFHTIWWVLLPSVYIFLRKKPILLPLLTLFSIVFVFETHHVIKAVIAGQYYPGAITAFFYPILGAFFYKELLKNWQLKSKT